MENNFSSNLFHEPNGTLWFDLEQKLPPNQTNREHYVLTIDLTKGSLPKRTSRRHKKRHQALERDRGIGFELSI